jgi:tetratricopeptide (TPR) repeat protein
MMPEAPHPIPMSRNDHTMIRIVLVFFFLIVSAFADPKAANRAAAAGEAALVGGEYAKAVEQFTKAIAEDETNPAFYGNRGSAYSYLGKLNEALQDYDTAIQKTVARSGNPKDKRLAYFLYNRGYAYEHAGRIQEALAEYQKTIELDPSYPDAHGNSAWIYATHSDPAIRNATKALEYALIEARRTKMKNAGALDTLAAAYAVNGQFDEARRHQEQAVAKAGSPEDKREFAERLRLYEQGTPYVEPSK